MKFDDIGLQIPDVLLPNAEISFENWAVVACDQFSSQPDYWQEVAEKIQDAKSTGHLIFPEAWLESGKDEEIISSIQNNMETYLQEGTFVEHSSTLVRCERTLANGQKRKGLILSLDLEHYSYEKGTETLIRATEGTIVDRLPPRIQIRKNAPLEFPHIMVLIDDPERSVIEPLFDIPAEPAYDFDLMQGGGHIKGNLIKDNAALTNFADTLRSLANSNNFQEKYGASAEQKPLLYAMGDGNHSFATAKAIWETMKEEQGFDAVKDHPARFALVELVNLYDDSLEFEAIHRVVFNTNPQELIDAFKTFYQNQEAEVVLGEFKTEDSTHTIPFYYEGNSGALVVKKPSHQLATGSLQIFLDNFLSNQPGCSIDYIHGEETTIELGQRSGNIGFLLPAITKDSLFKTVIFDGALPRKTFSMGDAEDKRYYLEGRKIK